MAIRVLWQEGPRTGAVEPESCLSSAAAESTALLSGAVQAPVPIMASSVVESTASPVGSLQ